MSDPQLQTLARRLVDPLLPLVMQRIYERGGWAPTLAGGTTPGTLTYTVQEGRFVRIAGTVIATATLTVNTASVAMTGTLILSGLPYPVDAASVIGGAVVASGAYNYTAGSLELKVFPVAGTSTAQLVETADNAATVTAIAGNVGAGTTLRVWLCYEAGGEPITTADELTLVASPTSIYLGSSGASTITATATVNGVPTAGLAVGFSIIGGSGGLSTVSAVTNGSGQATTLLNATAEGTITVQATSIGGISAIVEVEADDALVARWTLDDTSAGYIDLINGVALTAGGSGVTTAAGIINDAASFGGAGYLTTPDSAANSLAHGFAIETWIYPADNASGFIAAKDIAGGREWQLFRVSNTAAYFNFFIATIGTGEVSVSATGVSIPANAWSHLVAVAELGNGVSNGVAALYLNGVQIAALTISASLVDPEVTSTAMRIGAREFAGSPIYFNGRIDEVALWQFGADGDPGAGFWLDRYNGGAGRRP